MASALEARSLTAYVPLYKSIRNWSDRMKELDLPLFPGYVFCRLRPEDRLQVQTTPGVVRLVGSGRTPLPIDDSEMEALQVLVHSGLSPKPYSDPAVGDTVEIKGGPLNGATGILENVKDGRKLVVSITLLKRSVAVEFDDRWVAVKSSSTTNSSSNHSGANQARSTGRTLSGPVQGRDNRV